MIQNILNKSYSVFIAASLILWFFYSNVIKNINSVIFANGGDGLKNYYTYMFHAKHDQNFWDFKGMNYPFYEHIVYTDAHPLFSYLIGQFGLVDYGIGILNFLMLISYPISAIFIFKILKHYKVEVVWAFLSSLVICFMAPQIFRLTGHLSLSYVFAIPLMWYLLIKLQTTKKWEWSIAIFVLLFGFFFTHPYLGLILAIFGLAYAFIFFLFDRKSWLFYGLKVALPIVVSIVAFQMIVNATDAHVDRMETPAGFFNYYAKWNSLFVSHHGPMNKIKHALGFKMSGWESWTYIGLSTMVYLLIGIIYYIRNRSELSLRQLFSSPIGKLYLVGHLVLLFSFCFPLKYEGLRWIVDAFGPLKQFRVLGRFAWVYFYIVSITAVVILVKIKAQSGKKINWDILFYCGALFTMFEFAPVHMKMNKNIGETVNPFQKENVSDDLKDVMRWAEDQNYDAIMFLPFTHFSSENIFILGAEDANNDAMILSYHLNLPLLNTMTSRTSVSESVLFQNLFSPAFIEKDLDHIIGRDKKIMLIKNKDGLDINELRMLWSSEKIYKNETYAIFNFSFDKWNAADEFNQLMSLQKEAIIEVGSGWFSDTNSVWFIYDSFDGLYEENNMIGEGALAAKKQGIQVIKSDIVDLEEGAYICSFWYNYKIDRADQLAVVEHKYKDGSGQWVAQNSIRETNLIVGDWAHVEMEFEVSDSVANTKVFLSWNNSKQWLIVDEFLIRKAVDRPLFKKGKLKGEDYIIYNNYWLKANSFSK